MNEEMLNILNDLSKRETTDLALNVMELTADNLIKDKEIQRLKEVVKTVNRQHLATINKLIEVQNRIDKALDHIEKYCIDDEFYVNLTKKEKNIIVVKNILNRKED